MTLSQFQKARRVVLAVMLFLTFIALMVMGSAFSHRSHETIEAVGLVAIVLAILGRAWCTLYIGGRKSAEIVDDGPYSMVRNPLYVFSAIAAGGVGAQTGSVLVAGLFVVGCLASFAIVVRREETFLLQRFGRTYADYCARTPRFLPDPRRFRDRATLSVPADRLYRTLGDGMMFLVAIPAFETVEHLQNLGWVPVLLRLY